MSATPAVIFDLDGTLVDSFGPITESVGAARARAGLPPLEEAVVRRHVGRGLEALLDDLVPGLPVESSVRAFREHYAGIFLEGTRLLDGASAVTSALATAGFRLAVASNKPARFGARIVDQLGLAPAIELVLGPDAETPPKPEPTMLRTACRRLGAGPGECLYVGDMPLDVESAHRAGLDHVLIAGGTHTAAELCEIPGSRVLPGLPALGRLLLEQHRTPRDRGVHLEANS